MNPRMHKLRNCTQARVADLSLQSIPKRRMATSTSTSAQPNKASGDISSVFPSLSGVESPPLPPRFADLKTRLIKGHEDRVKDSWHRLLACLRQEVEVIKALGSAVIPEFEFGDMHDRKKRSVFRNGLRERGVGLIRGVVPEREALDWKEQLKKYIQSNPSTKGFPAVNPAVYELYWSPSQILARAHPHLLRTQTFLMSHWHSAKTSAQISTSHPIAYADRLRIRQPGDAGFALGPHIDGGSCERWEENGYGRGGVYNEIFRGNWEAYDPWESSCRLPVISSLYGGEGACSVYRMFQGWLSMSTTSAWEGTLMVNPLFKRATAYFLLRPFFQPRRGPTDVFGSDFLHPDNWRLEDRTTSVLQGAVPGNSQELNAALHPHLELQDTMVHIPQVRPGDYVAWHCDTIHAVDKIHAGKEDSSVMYIPACPLTKANAEYLATQRDTFFEGEPPLDFPPGVGESKHRGRLDPTSEAPQEMHIHAQRAMGLERFDAHETGLREGTRRLLKTANEILLPNEGRTALEWL